MTKKIAKTDSEWKKLLNPNLYHIAREKGTEAPFSGKYHSFTESGLYLCAVCGKELFDSNSKFDSGTGWPSFTKAVSNESVTFNSDTSHGMRRTEVVCSRCNAHLGHVFDDGPAETGQRFCINSASLDYKKAA